MFRDFSALGTERERRTVEEVTTDLELLLRHDQLYGAGYSYRDARGRGDGAGSAETEAPPLELLKPGFNISGDFDTVHYPFCVYVTHTLTHTHAHKELFSTLTRNATTD